MCRARNRFQLTVEPVEERWLPSALIPVLTTQAYHNAVVAVERVALDLARTHDVARTTMPSSSAAPLCRGGDPRTGPSSIVRLTSRRPL